MIFFCCTYASNPHQNVISGGLSEIIVVADPTICIVSFAAFICQPLTETTSVLEIDDGVICEDPSHVRMQWVSGVVIVIVNFGTPLGLLWKLTRTARFYESHTRKQYADVAKRMSAELGVELNTAEYVIRDIVVGKEFGFLMDGAKNMNVALKTRSFVQKRGILCPKTRNYVSKMMNFAAFQPEFLYWEALDMIRKLALAGLVLVVGRGSVAQLSTAIALAFGFFAVQMRSWPYKVHSDNMFRAASELHVFIVITTALVLKNDLTIEIVTEDTYDFILFFSFLVLVPLAFVISVISKVRFMKQAVTNGLQLKVVEPAEMRRRSFELHLVGLGSSDDKENLRRFIDGWAIRKTYSCFLSHYKMEAAAEARILKSELVRALKVPSETVFLDADNLTDLKKLKQCVEESDVFILMWTDGVLSRPWCLAELDTAAKAGIPILVVSINNMHSSPLTKINEILTDLPAYLKDKNALALDELKKQEIDLDPDIIGQTIMDAINRGKTALDGVETEELTSNPNQSTVMLQSQVCALAGAMVGVHCPENAALLPDLVPHDAEPWIVSRPIAIYIVYAEQDDQIKKVAESMKEWICRRCDIAPELVCLCSDSSDSSSDKNLGTVAGGCDDVATNVDTVIMLQSKRILNEPRSLARLYTAIVNRAPIVPVCLTYQKTEDESKLWNFETSKATLESLDHLSPSEVAAVAGACGVSAKQVGTALAQTIPNVISKPLAINGALTQFEAQMLDIELTLRREMPSAGKVAAKNSAKGVTDEGVPPAQSPRKDKPVRARIAARVVSRPKAEVGA